MPRHRLAALRLLPCALAALLVAALPGGGLGKTPAPAPKAPSAEENRSTVVRQVSGRGLAFAKACPDLSSRQAVRYDAARFSGCRLAWAADYETTFAGAKAAQKRRMRYEADLAAIPPESIGMARQAGECAATPPVFAVSVGQYEILQPSEADARRLADALAGLARQCRGR